MLKYRGILRPQGCASGWRPCEVLQPLNGAIMVVHMSSGTVLKRHLGYDKSEREAAQVMRFRELDSLSREVPGGWQKVTTSSV